MSKFRVHSMVGDLRAQTHAVSHLRGCHLSKQLFLFYLLGQYTLINIAVNVPELSKMLFFICSLDRCYKVSLKTESKIKMNTDRVHQHPKPSMRQCWSLRFVGAAGDAMRNPP